MLDSGKKIEFVDMLLKKDPQKTKVFHDRLSVLKEWGYCPSVQHISRRYKNWYITWLGTSFICEDYEKEVAIEVFVDTMFIENPKLCDSQLIKKLHENEKSIVKIIEDLRRRDEELSMREDELREAIKKLNDDRSSLCEDMKKSYVDFKMKSWYIYAD